MIKKLFLVRHGIAEDRTLFKKTGLADSERPLTSKGIKKMSQISNWLSLQMDGKADFLLESPLLRSQQTADILEHDCQFKKRILLSELDPSHPPELVCKKLDKLEWTSAVLVGHEPHLSHLICFLTGISAKHYAEFELKKGGIAYFKTEPRLLSRKAKLQWLITPKVILSL